MFKKFKPWIGTDKSGGVRVCFCVCVRACVGDEGKAIGCWSSRFTVFQLLGVVFDFAFGFLLILGSGLLAFFVGLHS